MLVHDTNSRRFPKQAMIIIFSIFILLAIGINGSEIQDNVFEKESKVSDYKCSSKDQLQNIIHTRSATECIVECSRTAACVSVFYTSDACVRCSARYTENDVTSLVPMPGSAYFSKAVRCEPGWKAFKQSCYYFDASVQNNVPKLKEYCSNIGAHLVVIADAQEQDFVESVVSATSTTSDIVWIGIGRNGPLDAWTSYFDNSVASFFNWYTNEPERELCVGMNKPFNWKWIDYYCPTIGHTVCEKEAM